jgi:hypothetical protein
LWSLAARLEAAPFQDGLQTACFPQVVKRCGTTSGHRSPEALRHPGGYHGAEQLAEKLVLYADNVPERLKPD